MGIRNAPVTLCRMERYTGSECPGYSVRDGRQGFTRYSVRDGKRWMGARMPMLLCGMGKKGRGPGCPGYSMRDGKRKIGVRMPTLLCERWERINGGRLFQSDVVKTIKLGIRVGRVGTCKTGILKH